MWLSSLFLLAICLHAIGCPGAIVQINPPANVPTGASRVVDHGYLGYGIESTDFPNYSGTFSQNLYDGIANRVGSPVYIRIGGTSM
jgi:hypothetical protein